MNRVVPHEFVVVNLLMRLGLGVCLQADILIVFEFARRGIALARGDARREVEIRKFQVRMSPVPVFPEQRREGAFVELRARDVAVHLILIRVRELLGVAQVPNRAALVARKVERIVEKSVVRLVFGLHIGAHRALRQRRLRAKHHHAGQGIGTVHQRSRTFQNLHRVHVGSIDFHAVLVAPLLSFLSDAVAHHRHAVVAQAANHGF